MKNAFSLKFFDLAVNHSYDVLIQRILKFNITCKLAGQCNLKNNTSTLGGALTVSNNVRPDPSGTETETHLYNVQRISFVVFLIMETVIEFFKKIFP